MHAGCVGHDFGKECILEILDNLGDLRLIPKRRFAQDHFERTRKGLLKNAVRSKTAQNIDYIFRPLKIFQCFGMLEMFIHTISISLK